MHTAYISNNQATIFRSRVEREGGGESERERGTVLSELNGSGGGGGEQYKTAYNESIR